MKTVGQQVYFISILMREAKRLAAGRQTLVLPIFAVLMRRLGVRFNMAGD